MSDRELEDEELVDRVAKVMGWEKRTGITQVWVDEMGFVQADERWRPDRDIAAAWLVVEKITEPPHDIETAKRMPNTKFGYWFDNANLWAMSASEAAEAICRAALMAVEAE